jgi:prevent-host-death family protein
MTSIIYYEAQTHFSALLDQVAKGKKILITRRGLPAALLCPVPAEASKDVRQVIGALKALRRGTTLGKGMSIRDMINEGRCF